MFIIKWLKRSTVTSLLFQIACQLALLDPPLLEVGNQLHNFRLEHSRRIRNIAFIGALMFEIPNSAICAFVQQLSVKRIKYIDGPHNFRLLGS